MKKFYFLILTLCCVFKNFGMNLSFDLELQFRETMISGDLNVLQKLLPEGISIGQLMKIKIYRDTIKFAAAKGHINIIQYLIENNVNIDTPSEWDIVLFNAVQSGNYSMVASLIKVNANVNFVNNDTRDSLLHISIRKTQPEMVKLLLDNKATTEVVNKKRVSILSECLEQYNSTKNEKCRVIARSLHDRGCILVSPMENLFFKRQELEILLGYKLDQSNRNVLFDVGLNVHLIKLIFDEYLAEKIESSLYE